MNYKKLTLFILIITGATSFAFTEPPLAGNGSSLGQSNAPTKENPVAKNRISSPTVRGLVLTATMPESNPAGLPIPIDVVIKNTGAKPVFLIDTDPSKFSRFDADVKTKKGDEVPRTRYWKEITGFYSMLSSRRFLHESIQGDSSRSLSLKNLALYYDLTLPGKYTVVVSRMFHFEIDEPFGRGSLLITPAIEFAVADP